MINLAKNIPNIKFSEGTKLCKKNILDFLESARILIEANRFNHGIIFFQFAKEEFGKLVWLLNLSKTSDSIISVPKKVFSSHKSKSKKAEDYFGEDLWLIKGGFDEKGFGKGFEHPIRSDHDIRLKCAFVDYNENNKEWKLGLSYDKEVLSYSLKRVKDKIESLIIS